MDDKEKLRMLSEVLHDIYLMLNGLQQACHYVMNSPGVKDSDAWRLASSERGMLFTRPKRPLIRELENCAESVREAIDDNLAKLCLRQVDFLEAETSNALDFLEGIRDLQVRKTVLDLNEVIADAVGLLELEAGTKSVEIRSQLVGGARVCGDRSLLFRMFLNVIANAVKYSYSSSQHSLLRYVEILSRTDSSLDGFVVQISSFGIGFTEEELQNELYFKWGYRGCYATERGRRGSGMGLSLAKRIAAVHGGDIELHSAPYHGDPVKTVVKIRVSSGL